METNSVSSSSASAFLSSISQKLDDLNFLLWRQQIELVIKSHKLKRFVANPQILLRFLTEADCDAGIENPAWDVGTAGLGSSHLVTVDSVYIDFISNHWLRPFESTIIFTNRYEPKQDGFKLNCVRQCLKTSRCASFCLESKPFPTHLPLLEVQFLFRNTLMLYLKVFHKIIIQ